MRDCSLTTHPHQTEYFWYALPELSFYSLFTQTHLIMCSSLCVTIPPTQEAKHRSCKSLDEKLESSIRDYSGI